MTTPSQILSTPSSRHKLHSDFFLGPPLVAHRRGILKKNNMCFSCIGIGHVASKCRSRGCIKCGGKHHISLCDNGHDDQQRNKSDFNQGSEKGMRALDELTTLHTSVVAKVNGVNARIMLDSKAGRTYVCTSGVASGYSRYSMNTLQFADKIVNCIMLR